MKKLLLFIFFSFLISSSVFARSTGCKEGNCENGYGKWVYTDKTTYEGEWVATKKDCLLYTSPSPRDKRQSRMPSSA